MSFLPTVESWRQLFVIFGPDIPVLVCLAWIAEESGGNPCAIGVTPTPGASQPQEYGIGQLNAKDPGNLKIASPQKVRGSGAGALCGIGPSRAQWERMLRPLTEGERAEQASQCLELIRQCRQEAVARIGSWGWDPRSADFWQMVKLWHASPALVKVAPQIETSLGRPPRSFAEYQSHADAVGLANHIGAGHDGGTRGYLDSVWLNVNRIGKALQAPTIGV